MKRIAAVLLAIMLLFSLTLTVYAEPDSPADGVEDQFPGPPGPAEDNPGDLEDHVEIAPDETQVQATEASQESEPTEALTEAPTQAASEEEEATQPKPEKSSDTLQKPEATQPNASAEGAKDDAVNRTAIIVVIICGAVLLVLLIVIVALLMRKKQPTEKEKAHHGLSAHGLPVHIEILSGACYNAGSEFRLRRNLTIGTDKGCDLVFDDPEMLPMHAVITYDGGKVKLEDCAETGKVYVGGMKIFAPNRLRPEDVVTVGTTSFRIFYEK